MKLSELEAKVRQEHEQAIAETEKEAQQEAAKREKFRQEVIAWMTSESDLEGSELQEYLAASTDEFLGNYGLILNIPGHTPIHFAIEREHETRAIKRVYRGQFKTDRNRWSHNLGDALIAARERYREERDQEHRKAEAEAEREARRGAAEQESARLGQYYLDLLEEHPILRSLLDVLAAYLEDREEFQAALDNAEHWAEGTERIMGEKLQQAKAELERAYEDTRQIEDKLRQKEDEYAEEQRKRERGW